MSPPAPYPELKYFLLFHPSPFVTHVQINRPAKLNAFNQAMWLEMGALFRVLSHDPDVRAVVLSGAGDRAFTAGLDVKEAAEGDIIGAGDEKGKEMDGARKAWKLRRHIDEFQGAISEIERCEKPVICILHALSLGLALDISSACDIRLCTQSVSLAAKEVDIGLAADIGTLARLPKIVSSSSWVREVCLTGRTFGAAEALRVGFVSEVRGTKEEAVERGLEMAGRIAGKSPVAVQGTKEVLVHGRDHSVGDNLRYVSVWNSAALQSNDVKAALMSGLKKTKPTFEKL